MPGNDTWDIWVLHTQAVFNVVQLTDRLRELWQVLTSTRPLLLGAAGRDAESEPGPLTNDRVVVQVLFTREPEC